MSRVTSTAPADTDLLCETCGYVLNGLSAESRCPECGTPIRESAPETRNLPAWERRPGIGSLLSTAAAVLSRPKMFFRGLQTRSSALHLGAWFAGICWVLSAVLFAAAARLHAEIVGFDLRRPWWPPLLVVAALLFVGITFVLAVRLTAWEAAYRGLRLPLATVRRALYYHAPHYLPVAAVGLAVPWTYAALLDRGATTLATLPYYLYTLSGAVVLGAIYLFKTYWTAMRNVMFANA